jgi:hypothetical protein
MKARVHCIRAKDFLKSTLILTSKTKPKILPHPLDRRQGGIQNGLTALMKKKNILPLLPIKLGISIVQPATLVSYID